MKKQAPLDEIEELAPILEIDEDGIHGEYFNDKSGFLYLTLKNAKKYRDGCWWDYKNWGVESGTITHHIKHLDNDIEYAEKRLKIMKRARTILKSKIKEIQ